MDRIRSSTPRARFVKKQATSPAKTERTVNSFPAASDAVDYDLVVAGGGAAGFFAAITCAESCPGSRVVILEKSSKVLGKVKISGGGRCNVTHACFDPREMTSFYPRGSRQLIGPLHRWGPADTMAWFEDRGVALKTEADGRVFPRSDDSQSIIDCLTSAAVDAGVIVRTSTAVENVSGSPRGGFDISLSGGEQVRGCHFLLTTGGTRNRIGAEIAASFGHRIEPAAPSLFTFVIDDPRIARLQGLSVGNARVGVARAAGGLDLEARGPLLVTHWGLSGPAILRLSAWGARELQKINYRFEIVINWCADRSEEDIIARFDGLRVDTPRRKLVNDPQFEIPARLWKRLVEAAAKEPAGDRKDEDAAALRWSQMPRDVCRSLAQQVGAGRFTVDGKSMNKDEFVTCGGVRLDDVQFKTMGSRLVEALYFAGEVLDIDGLTGGFNFQSAWTTGRIAGEAIAAAIDASKGKGSRESWSDGFRAF